MFLKNFNYRLPKKMIAQSPVRPRDCSKLLVLNRGTGSVLHKKFFRLPEILRGGDIIVLNNSRVIRARLFTTNGNEVLLLRKIKTPKYKTQRWECLVKPGRKFKIRKKFEIIGKNWRKLEKIIGKVVDIVSDGVRIIEFGVLDVKFNGFLQKYGHIPVPPYIAKEPDKINKYQTVYAEKDGSSAAPTAGLHFTKRLIGRLKKRGVGIEFITLHAGIGTFQPVREYHIEDHKMHREFFEIKENTAKKLNKYKKEGRRIIAVGTTSCRALEGCSSKRHCLIAGHGDTDLYIYPGYEFKFIDGIITNFHLPKSTLLMLVSAFAGRKKIMHAYKEAIKNKYRFYSFGDAMLII